MGMPVRGQEGAAGITCVHLRRWVLLRTNLHAAEWMVYLLLKTLESSCVLHNVSLCVHGRFKLHWAVFLCSLRFGWHLYVGQTFKSVACCTI